MSSPSIAPSALVPLPVVMPRVPSARGIIGSTHDAVAFLAATARRVDAGSLPPGYAPFAAAYHAFTLEMLARLSSGVFEDPVRMSDFVVRFCARYQFALTAGDACPAPWQVAFDAANAAPGRAIGNLLLGVNAHMSYDLCAVIVGLLDEYRAIDLESDVLAINDVIDTGVAPVQRAVAMRSRHAGVLAGAAGGIDLLATWQLFKRWRHRAWHDALAIKAGETTLARVETRVAARATWLRRLPL